MSESTDPSAAAITPLQAVAGTFTSPGDTFSRLLKRPTWWLPLVIWALLAPTAFYVATTRVDWERSAAEAMEKQAARGGGAQQQVPVERVAGFMKSMTRISVPIVLVAVFFLAALVLWGAGRAMGGELGFGQTLALWGHANLANAVGSIFSIPVFLAQREESVTLEGLERVVMSNVGALLPDSTAKPLLVAAGSLDVFSFAALALLVIGFRRVPGLSKGAATAVPIVLWGLWVISKIAMASLR